MDWRAAAWAGIAAGSVFLIIEMLLVPLLQNGSPWEMPRMIAAIVLGPALFDATFGVGALLIALAIHFALSLTFALVLAKLVRNASPSIATLVGITFGLVIYAIDFHGLTALFPWFAEARNLITVLAHAAFGGVAGYAYRALGVERDVSVTGRTRAPLI